MTRRSPFVIELSAQDRAVLEQRARLGVALWHPYDAPMDVESLALGVA